MTKREEAWQKTKNRLGWQYLDGDLVSCHYLQIFKHKVIFPVRWEYINWYEEMENRYGSS